jgi:transcriptional regulator GlxA family with amidase domain
VQRVAILIADGFTDSGLSIALDVLRAANALAGRAGQVAPFRVEVASARGGRVRAASGLVLEATRGVARLRADVVLVPGIWIDRARELVPLLARPDVQRLVRAIGLAHARGALIASSCGGAFLLADAGLLDGRPATTTWWLAPQLRARRPRVEVEAEAALITGRRIVTGGAVFAMADVALHLVARFAGPALARACARVLLLDTHPSQAPYMAAQQLRSDDPVVARAERWVRGHLAESFAIATLARHVSTSPRTLARRLHAAVGLGPVGFVQRLRVEAAVLLLQTSPLSLAEISARVGYANPSTLSRLIRRETRASPQALRRRS